MIFYSGGNKITGKGIEYIVAAKLNLNNLDLSIFFFYLDRNPIGDQGLKVFCQLNLSNFTSLNLDNTSITDFGLVNFENVKLPAVEDISVSK